MELWMSAEYSGDIDDQLREASNFVEDEINKIIKSKEYDLELDSWDCIAIIMEDNDYDEIIKYSKKKRDMDFRLKIDHKEFRNSTSQGQQKLFYNMLLRSLDFLIEKGLNENAITMIRNDINSAAKINEWL